MYDDRFYEHMASLYTRDTAWSRLRLAQVKRMIDPRPGDRIIDLGCGMGSVSHFCAIHGAQVVGVDLSSKALESARRLFPDVPVSYYERDVANLDGIESTSFDKAVSADLVEHIPQDVFENMLKETWRVLKPGGALFIYTPNPQHLIERLKAHNFILKQNPTHIDVKSKHRLLASIECAGFCVDRVYSTASFIPVFNLVERILMPLPIVGAWFQYRTCIRCRKQAHNPGYSQD